MRSQHGVGDQSAKLIKKLHDNSLKLEQFYSNMFTGLKISVVICHTRFPFMREKRRVSVSSLQDIGKSAQFIDNVCRAKC